MPGNRVLMVEGVDDEHVLKHICDKHSVGFLNFKVAKSVENLLEALPTTLKTSDIYALGVILDADTNIAARWDSIKARLATAGYQGIPDHPATDGTILEPPSPESLLPRFGAWIMPDNTSTGILEDFLRFLVPATGAELLHYSEQCVDGIPAQKKCFRDIDRPKALIHTWLAWQEKPGLPFGTAIKASFLDANLPQAKILGAWLKRLFS
jgi:hypothetical protein